MTDYQSVLCFLVADKESIIVGPQHAFSTFAALGFHLHTDHVAASVSADLPSLSRQSVQIVVAEPEVVACAAEAVLVVGPRPGELERRVR